MGAYGDWQQKEWRDEYYERRRTKHPNGYLTGVETMTITKCDRCGISTEDGNDIRMFECTMRTKPLLSVQTDSGIGTTQAKVELCQSCVLIVKDFMTKAV